MSRKEFKRVTGQKAIIPIGQIEQRILLIRGQRVMLDADLAMLYGVPTRVLNQAVRRNLKRFPRDFMFKLTQPEKNEVITICDHLKNLKYAKALPNAFTEHGAIMVASVLNTQRAIQVSVFVVRAFVKLREMLSTHKELIHKLAALERRLQNHDESIRSLVVAIRQLMRPSEPETPKKRIGFLVEEPKIPYITQTKRKS
jgi:phage regulator Rha-like protein